jgi:hypothetical protein
MVVPSFPGRLVAVFLVLGVLALQPNNNTQAPTQAQMSSVTSVTTYTSTTFTLTTSTITSLTTAYVNVSVVGTVSVGKVITQFDIWSQAALVVATLGSGAVGWFLGTFAQSPRQGALLVYENKVYCRKHGVLVTLTPAGLYCPVHRKVVA